MGCFASRIAGEDFTTINADMAGFSAHKHKPSGDDVHYETAEEHERDLRRLKSQQSERRASRPAYVDPNDLPMPPKTTHQHYHRRPSEMEEVQRQGWKEKVKMAVMTPEGEKGRGLNTGLTREEVLRRGYPGRGAQGMFVPGARRESARGEVQNRTVF